MLTQGQAPYWARFAMPFARALEPPAHFASSLCFLPSSFPGQNQVLLEHVHLSLNTII